MALAYDDYDDHRDAGSGDCVVLIHGRGRDRPGRDLVSIIQNGQWRLFTGHHHSRGPA